MQEDFQPAQPTDLLETQKTHRYRFLVAIILAVVVLSGGAWVVYRGMDFPLPGGTGQKILPERPNIILVLADDLDLASMSHFSKLKQSMTDEGMTFTNHIVNIALCCPSRATILRGQYAHSTEVFSNRPPTGGYETFHDVGNEESTLAVWLQDKGYRTALMGKYLNGYPPPSTAHIPVPPGWTEWYVPVKGKAYDMYNYSMYENGPVVEYGKDSDDYITTVLDKKAQDFIRRSVAEKDPFFLYLAVYAPHRPATPPPQYKDELPGIKAPRTASFNEEDVSDKPVWLRNASTVGTKNIDNLYRPRILSMFAVEDMVDHLIQTLEEVGQLDNTYIVFTSDNGFHLGQHRLRPGKNTAFETDIHVPLIIRGPGIERGVTSDELTSNVDFAPTFAALAGVTPPEFVEGRSLIPLILDTAGSWRQGVLLEHKESLPEELDNSAIPEPRDDDSINTNTDSVPPFVGVRTRQHTYVLYISGEEELYDNLKDPEQLENIASTADKGLLEQFKRVVGALAECKGAACRSIEENF